MENFWWLFLKATVQNRITSFWTVTFSAYGSVCFEFFAVTVTSETIFKKESNHPVFVNTKLVFLLAVCANSLVDSFKFMLMITNLIARRIGKLILNHLVGNTCPEFRNGLLDSYFFILSLGRDCLELCFWRVAFKIILTQQYYKNTSRFQTRALSTIWYIYRH